MVIFWDWFLHPAKQHAKDAKNIQISIRNGQILRKNLVRHFGFRLILSSSLTVTTITATVSVTTYLHHTAVSFHSRMSRKTGWILDFRKTWGGRGDLVVFRWLDSKKLSLKWNCKREKIVCWKVSSGRQKFRNSRKRMGKIKMPLLGYL